MISSKGCAKYVADKGIGRINLQSCIPFYNTPCKLLHRPIIGMCSSGLSGVNEHCFIHASHYLTSSPDLYVTANHGAVLLFFQHHPGTL